MGSGFWLWSAGAATLFLSTIVHYLVYFVNVFQAFEVLFPLYLFHVAGAGAGLFCAWVLGDMLAAAGAG